jgi:hypothetical protein
MTVTLLFLTFRHHHNSIAGSAGKTLELLKIDTFALAYSMFVILEAKALEKKKRPFPPINVNKDSNISTRSHQTCTPCLEQKRFPEHQNACFPLFLTLNFQTAITEENFFLFSLGPVC